MAQSELFEQRLIKGKFPFCKPKGCWEGTRTLVFANVLELFGTKKRKSPNARSSRWQEEKWQ